MTSYDGPKDCGTHRLSVGRSVGEWQSYENDATPLFKNKRTNPRTARNAFVVSLVLTSRRRRHADVCACVSLCRTFHSIPSNYTTVAQLTIDCCFLFDVLLNFRTTIVDEDEKEVGGGGGGGASARRGRAASAAASARRPAPNPGVREHAPAAASAAAAARRAQPAVVRRPWSRAARSRAPRPPPPRRPSAAPRRLRPTPSE